MFYNLILVTDKVLNLTNGLNINCVEIEFPFCAIRNCLVQLESFQHPNHCYIVLIIAFRIILNLKKILKLIEEVTVSCFFFCFIVFRMQFHIN